MSGRLPSRARLPQPAGLAAPASVGLLQAPYGVYPLASQVHVGPFPASSLAIPQTADLFFVDQPFLPTVRQYLPVSRGRAQGPNGGAGGRLLSPPPTIHPVFWAVTVWAKELVRAPGQPVPSDPQIAGGLGSQASYYKLRVQWNQYPSRLREIIVDIGDGVDLTIGPTTNLYVDLMAPDPASGDPLPPDFDGFRVDAYVVASAWGTSVPLGHPTGRFTQALFFPDPETTPTRCVHIADGARTLQVLGDINGEPSSAFWSPDDQDGSALPGLGNITVATAAGETGTDIVEIPQNAKAVCFAAAPGSLFSVVQGLEL